MLYLHIPYCKQACSYCNFHFSTNLKERKQLLAAMQREMVLREEEISALMPETVYLGGGTPSLLTKSELDDLFGVIFKTYTGAELEVGSQVFDQLEITLEANPDDLDDATIKRLADSPVNRLSIGLQSFSE
ncbi:MAG: radical SAM protein, partial [Bacteroidota bacterium]